MTAVVVRAKSWLEMTVIFQTKGTCLLTTCGYLNCKLLDRLRNTLLVSWYHDEEAKGDNLWIRQIEAGTKWPSIFRHFKIGFLERQFKIRFFGWTNGNFKFHRSLFHNWQWIVIWQGGDLSSNGMKATSRKHLITYSMKNIYGQPELCQHKQCMLWIAGNNIINSWDGRIWITFHCNAPFNWQHQIYINTKPDI